MTHPQDGDPDEMGDLSQVVDLPVLAVQLRRLGARRRRDWDTLCRLVPNAVDAGMSEAEVARRSGMSRSYVRKLLGKTP